MCHLCIEAKVAALRAEREQQAIITQAIDELIMEGLIEWTGEYRDGQPVYRAVDP